MRKSDLLPPAALCNQGQKFIQRLSQHHEAASILVTPFLKHKTGTGSPIPDLLQHLAAAYLTMAVLYHKARI